MNGETRLPTEEIRYIAPAEMPVCPDGKDCDTANRLMELANLGQLGHETPVTLSQGLQCATETSINHNFDRVKCFGGRCAARAIARLYSIPITSPQN